MIMNVDKWHYLILYEVPFDEVERSGVHLATTIRDYTHGEIHLFARDLSPSRTPGNI